MAYRIKNTSPGPRGIHTLDSGLVFIPPGEARTVDPVDMERVRRHEFFEIDEIDAAVPKVSEDLAAAFAKMDPDGNGAPGGSKKGAESTASKGAAKRRARAAKAPAKTSTPKKRRKSTKAAR